MPGRDGFNAAQVRAIALSAAGAGAAAVMEQHPEDVMPTELILERVAFILNEFGIRSPEKEDKSLMSQSNCLPSQQTPPDQETLGELEQDFDRKSRALAMIAVRLLEEADRETLDDVRRRYSRLGDAFNDERVLVAEALARRFQMTPPERSNR